MGAHHSLIIIVGGLCTCGSRGPLRIGKPGVNHSSVGVLSCCEILREPALVADENGGVVVVPIGDGVAASPGGVVGLVRPLGIGRAGAVDGEEDEEVVDLDAPVVIEVGGDGDDALLIYRIPDCAFAA